MEKIDDYLYELVKYAGDVIFTVGPTQCILSWNRGSEELLGYKPEDIIGKSVDILSPLDKKRQMRSMVVEVMEEGTLKNLECELIGQNGTTSMVYVTASPIRDQGQHVIAVSIIAKDITDQNKLLLALIAKERRSAQMEALVQSLTTVSHHIRNAAMIISARAEVALEMKDAVHFTEMAKACIYQTKRISAVIESLNDTVKEVMARDQDVHTVEVEGSPAPQLDIEARLKERLRKIDEGAHEK